MVSFLRSAARRLPGQRRMLLSMLSGLVVLGGACGWFLREQIMQHDAAMLRESSYVRTLLIAHRMFLHDPPPGALAPPNDFDRLATRIDRRLGVTVRLPGNGEQALTFCGGKLLPLGSGLAALLLFERDRRRVSLIVAPDAVDGAQAAFNRSVQDTSISLAEENGFQLGIVGQVSPAELDFLKRIVEEEGGI